MARKSVAIQPQKVKVGTGGQKKVNLYFELTPHEQRFGQNAGFREIIEENIRGIWKETGLTTFYYLAENALVCPKPGRLKSTLDKLARTRASETKKELYWQAVWKNTEATMPWKIEEISPTPLTLSDGRTLQLYFLFPWLENHFRETQAEAEKFIEEFMRATPEAPAVLILGEGEVKSIYAGEHDYAMRLIGDQRFLTAMTPVQKIAKDLKLCRHCPMPYCSSRMPKDKYQGDLTEEEAEELLLTRRQKTEANVAEILTDPPTYAELLQLLRGFDDKSAHRPGKTEMGFPLSDPLSDKPVD